MKLEFIKIFVKAKDYNSPAFMYLKNIFLRISEAKLKESVRVGPQ